MAILVVLDLPLYLAVIFTVPGLTAVTTPFLFTLAILLLLDLYLATLVTFLPL